MNFTLDSFKKPRIHPSRSRHRAALPRLLMSRLTFHRTQKKRSYSLLRYKSFIFCILCCSKEKQKSKKHAITYHQDGHEGPLQEPAQHVAPVVFIIRHPGESRVHRGGDEEELEGGPQQPCPFHLQSSLQVELEGGEAGRGQTDCQNVGQLCLE